MSLDKLKKLIPLTETTYMILVSLIESRHGYGIIQHVDALSDGRIVLGPGTLYGALSKLEKQGFIRKDKEHSADRRKNYLLTDEGLLLIKLELSRLEQLYSVTKPLITRR